MEKGHYGQYSGNARHSRVTDHNMAATKRDDEAHMEYLKEDVKYDNKHGHSDIDMTADEKHISKLAGDLKYDEKHHGAGKHIDPNVDHPNYGDIKEAPSKLTQAYRSFKNDKTGPYSMARNLVSTAAALAPIPSLGKVKAVKKLGAVIKHNANIGTFGQTVRTYSLFGAKGFKSSFGKVDDALINRTSGDMRKSTSQNLQEAFSYPREVLKHKFPTSKQVPIIGKPGTTISRPASSSTKQVSYSNPRISGRTGSKPVDFKGPNPAHNIGAGGNSYPK